MTRPRFPLTSDQLELLVAFANAGSLAKLSELMAKDMSVVSRNIQRLGELFPVVVKVRGRWQLSSLGKQVIARTQNYLSELDGLLEHSNRREVAHSSYIPNKKSALIIINAQKALLDPFQKKRSNENAELNLLMVLSEWRKKERPVFHVKHVSENPDSLFYRENIGSHFLEGMQPLGAEVTLEKTKSSAFAGTSLLDLLQNSSITSVVIVGFTANECIDATARQACDLGFETVVVGDATASFDIIGKQGRLYKADRIHRLTLANLEALYARVVSTKSLLNL